MDTSVKGLIAESKRRMGAIEKGLVPIVEALIANVHARGVDMVITQGKRTLEQQAVLYGQGRSSYIYKGKQYASKGNIVTNAKPGTSIHNYGIALDFALIKNDKTFIWDTKADLDNDGKSDWMEVVEEAKALGFTWGGDWVSFRDFPHLEYIGGLTYAQVFAGKKPTFKAPKPSIVKASTPAKFYTKAVKQIEAKTPIAVYSDTEFKKPISSRKLPKGTKVRVIGITKSKSGTPRFITPDGLITANKLYVKEIVAAKPKAPANTSTIKIKSGDTLSALAKKYGTTVAKLQSLNGLKTTALSAGKTIKVPKVAVKKPETKNYKIKSRDTLSNIAVAHKTTVANLMKLNSLKNSVIVAGKTIKVPK